MGEMADEIFDQAMRDEFLLIRETRNTKQHNSKAKNCPLCKGSGKKNVLHIGEYEEINMSVDCSCTRLSALDKKEAIK